ncbi:MAG: helix-turn-helix domain-containing protein [Chthoniobacterales bacterium]
MKPKKSPLLQGFGMNVRRLRSAAGLTQEAVARKAGLATPYVSNIERGVRNPSLRCIGRIAQAFGISVSDLCEGLPERKDGSQSPRGSQFRSRGAS